jgi:site-specific recombinase XerD
MIKVFLREKKLLHGKRGLYLDFYPPVIDPETLKPTRREHLKLYIFERPKTETQRDHNKETKLLGENIRAQRQLELQAGAYGFVATRNRNKDFIAFLKEIRDSKKHESESNYYHWNSMMIHFRKFAGESVKFRAITENLCRDFKEHLRYKAGLSQNSAAGYFDAFKSAVRQAFEKRLLAHNPSKKVKGIEAEETQREYLTLSELQSLAKTPLEPEDIRRAALFSSLTGLRLSDIQKLIWSEIQHSAEQGYYIRFRQKKTKGAETQPISKEAFELLGERGTQDEQIFPALAKWRVHYYLPRWVAAAGIERSITFHSFRHTYATLQLTFGTDIYPISKMLGHKHVQTTQIYTKIIDQKKREAASRISLK